VAKERGLPTLDGRVAKVKDGWRVELDLRAPGGAAIAHAVAVEEPYLIHAIRTATESLWSNPPLVAAKIDPEVARWTALPDVEAGLALVDIVQNDLADGCDAIRNRRAELGLSYADFADQCPDTPSLPDAGGVVLDESSGSSLATTFWAFPPSSLSDEEARRIVSVVDRLRASEPSRFGQAWLDLVSGFLRGSLGEPDRAHSAFLAAVAEDPLNHYAWYQLDYAAGQTGQGGATKMLASIWLPQEAAFLPHSFELDTDALDVRLHDAQLGYILEPIVSRILILGRALAEAGRAEEVRALMATTPLGHKVPDANLTSYLLACIDMHDAMLERALGHFTDAGRNGLENVPIIASVLGRTAEVSTAWATSFLKMPAGEPKATTLSHVAAVALCMGAGGDVGQAGGRVIRGLQPLGRRRRCLPRGRQTLRFG
jgi:hypothetical protein